MDYFPRFYDKDNSIDDDKNIFTPFTNASLLPGDRAACDHQGE